MTKKEFFESLLNGLRLSDSAEKFEVSSGVKNNRVQQLLIKGYRNDCVVYFNRNVVEIISTDRVTLEEKHYSEINWNKAFNGNMIPLTIKEILKNI